MKDTKQNLIDEMKERILIGFLNDLKNLALVKSMDSVSGEIEEINLAVEDMGGIIKISGEWDREDLKSLLISRVG